jgi:pyruvate dehydrogenase E2 component (dihydrolipoyllysine-residue acetyltransferase)
MPTIVTMPKWGLTMTSGTITGWSHQEGDAVSEGSPLLTVETEKAVDDIEAPASGVLRKIVADTGAEVPVMGAVAVIVAPGEDLSDDDLATLLASSGPAAAAGGAAGARVTRERRQAATDSGGRVSASPAARKLAAELGIDLATVEASGPNGRVTSEDVERAAANAAQAAAAPRVETVTLDNGSEISALVAGAADAPATLVFIHGLGGSQSTWATVLGNFADNSRVVALDLPGHGASSKPTPDEGGDYSLPALAAAVGEVIEKLDLAPAILIGHSLGGGAALDLALARPKLVRGLVLVDSVGLGAEVSGDLLDRIEAEPSREEARKLLELFYANKRLVLDRGIDDMYAGRIAPGADAAVKAAASTVFSREGQTIRYDERLGELTQPILIVWGEQDAVIPAAHGVAAARAVPRAWFELLEDVGHVPQIEASQAFSNVVKRWLATLPAS